MKRLAIIGISSLLLLTGYKYEINYNPKMWVPLKLKNVD